MRSFPVHRAEFLSGVQNLWEYLQSALMSVNTSRNLYP